MTFDHDPDRLIGTWLDEGPRSFAPSLLDRTLADIHASPQQRRRPAPWIPFTISLTFKAGLAGALVLALLLGTRALLPWFPSLVTGPTASPTPATSPTASGSPESIPSPAPTPDPVFVSGPPPLVGTTWQLVGRIDPDRTATSPAYVSARPGEPALLRFDRGGGFVGTTGCRTIGGGYDAEPTGSRTVPLDLTVGDLRTFSCVAPIDSQDGGVLAALDGAGGLQLTTEPYGTLAGGLTESDLDSTLLGHFQAWPDLTRLIIRDQSGEGTLIYASVQPDLAGLISSDWGIAGYLAGSVIVPATDGEPRIRFLEDGTFVADDGCGTQGGTWGVPALPDGAPVPGDVDVDISRDPDGCGQDPQPAAIHALLQQLDLGWGATRGTGALTLPRLTEVSDALMARFVASPGTRWLLLYDADRRVALVLTQVVVTGTLPVDPSPSPAPIAFQAGEPPIAGTNWLVVGYQARQADPAATGIPTYLATVPGTRPFVRFSGDGSVIGSFGGCTDFVAEALPVPGGGRQPPTFRVTDTAEYGDCSDADARQGLLLQTLFERASSLELADAGFKVLAEGIMPDHVATVLREHFDAWPGSRHLILADDTGTAMIVLAPVDGALATRLAPTDLP